MSTESPARRPAQPVPTAKRPRKSAKPTVSRFAGVRAVASVRSSARGLTRNEFVCVTTTVDSEAKAGDIARRIVTARLAACVQYFSIRSIYRWKGHMESADEQLLLAKTRKALAPALVAFVRQHHDYEVPEITITPIAGGLSAYLDWIGAETKAPEKS